MHLIRSLRVICHKCYSLMNHQQQASTISGRATSIGTTSFVTSSKLLLYHQFHRSNLFINPIIHGYPRIIQQDQSAENKEERTSKFCILSPEIYDSCLLKAVNKCKTNCFYVYNHYGDGVKAYHTSSTTLKKFINNSESSHATSEVRVNDSVDENRFDRESFVAFAGLGFIDREDKLLSRLSEAKQLTGLEYIDYVTVQVR